MYKLKKIVLAVIGLLFSVSVSAHDFKVDGIYYNITSSTDMTVEVTYRGDDSISYDEYSGAVSIPESVTYNSCTYDVTSIGEYAFDYCSSLTSVEIPNSVTSIESHAFSGCSALTSVEIPNSVTSIESYAFSICSALTSVEIPNSVTSIESYAFSGCSALTSVVIPNSVTTIETRVFSNCSNLTSVTIPNSVTSIESYAFYGCLGLTSVEIPNSVTSIGWRAFDGCTNLKMVLNSSDLTFTKGSDAHGSIAYYADMVLNTYDGRIDDFIFVKDNDIYYLQAYVGSEKKLVLPENYKDSNYVIAASVFEGCSELTSVVIPNCVTAMGEGVFRDCSNLTSVTIPNSLTSIGDKAFDRCSKLASITLPNSVIRIGYAAFWGCSSLTSVVIPNSVTSIEDYAFQDCSSLTSVVIGNSVTSIGDNAFEGCENLKTVVNNSDLTFTKGSVDYGYIAYYANAIYNNCDIVGDFIFTEENGNYILCAYIGHDTELVLPENYKGGNYAIAASVFKGCSGLTSVEIPNSVTSIGKNAFSGCYSLNAVHINDISSWCNIEFIDGDSSNPLYYAHNLYLNGEAVTNLVVPSTVTSLKRDAFARCYSLNSVIIGNSVTHIDVGAFYLCSGLTSFEIGNSVTSIGEAAFHGCSGLTSVEIPNSVTSIGDNAFQGCENLKTVVNNSDLTFTKGSADYGYIAYYANAVYNNCDQVGDFIFTEENGNDILCAYIGNDTELVLPENYKGGNYAIGASVFEGRSGLTSVEIPNSVTAIGEGVFRECSNLTSITIPNSVTVISDKAFDRCSKLASITIPNSVIRIGYATFWGCSSLTSVAIPNSVTSIGDYAFEGCRNLKTVVNFSDLTFTKGSVDYGYIAYYANAVYNNCDQVGDFIFTEENGINHLQMYIGNDTDLVLPENYKGGNYAIGASVFHGCAGLTSVVIPNSVTSIGERAFYGCSGLTSVEIPNSVTSIGDFAFYECTGITSVEIGNNVRSIGRDVFYGCSGLTSVEIPNSVTSIGIYAFQECSSLTSVKIGNGVTSIGSDAFDNCSALTSVHIDDIAAWCEINFGNVYANPLYYAKNLYLNGEELTDVVIPNDVTIIGDYAFYNCSGLISVVIPNGVTSIGVSAFHGCQNMEYLYISSEIESIGEFAFYDCENLMDILMASRKTITASENIFSEVAYNNACLYVPQGRKFAYEKTVPWNKFYILERDFTDIEEVPEDYDLKDGVVYNRTSTCLVNSVTYTRTLPNLHWNALYVPFELPYDVIADRYDVAYINDVNGYDTDENGEIDDLAMEIIRIKGGTLKANYPYLIKAKTEADKTMSITVEDATLYAAEENAVDCSSVYQNYVIKGTYTKKTAEELAGKLAISTSGAWQPLAEGTALNPFRLYLSIENRDNSPLKVEPAAMSRMRIVERGETTGIEEGVPSQQREDVIFDLSGRRVKQPVKGGVYIVNGKKRIL